jgi:hypothetical protein
VHGHCHDKAVLNFDCEKQLLKEMGVELECPDTGCCGMAGGFGFEQEHVGVSLACGERVLLPQVRAAAKETLIVADGFSCREQIRQTTDRKALHLAQVLKMAAASGAEGTPRPYPENDYVTPDYRIRSIEKLLFWSGAAVIAGALIAMWKKARGATR